MADLNTDGLENLLNIRNEENNEEVKPIYDYKFLEDDDTDYNNPEEIIKTNMKRANSMLNKIEDEFARGNFSARLVEVASLLINGITQSANNMMQSTNYNRYLEIREELVKLKAKEVEIKEKLTQGKKGGTINNNLIISREDLLKIANSKNENIKNITEVKKIEKKGENNE